MLAAARTAVDEAGLANVMFVEGRADALPFDDASFDVAISNGVFDLYPTRTPPSRRSTACSAQADGSSSPTSRSGVPSATTVAEPSTYGLDESPAPLLEAGYARRLASYGFERIETGNLIDTYARSLFEDTRRKAEKYGARGTTITAFKAQ